MSGEEKAVRNVEGHRVTYPHQRSLRDRASQGAVLAALQVPPVEGRSMKAQRPSAGEMDRLDERVEGDRTVALTSHGRREPGTYLDNNLTLYRYWWRACMDVAGVATIGGCRSRRVGTGRVVRR